jgi:signal transduction histidine kinase
MALKNNMSYMWQMNMVQLVLMLALLVDWASFIALILIGFFLAYLAYRVLAPNIGLPNVSSGIFFPFIYTVVLYTILSKNKKKLDEEKLQSLQALSGSIAHELRTPLRTINYSAGGIKDFLPILIDGYEFAKKNNPKIAEISCHQYRMLLSTCTRIESESNAAFSIIDMLLMNVNHPKITSKELKNYSIIECLEKALERYPFDANEEKLIQRKNEEDFIFQGNEILMIHVLFNLLKNSLFSIKTSRKGNIEIWTQQEKWQNILFFKDTGQGISKKSLPHIFDTFYTKTPHGTGLGLSFSKMVMRNIGGDIKCTSIENFSTIFTLYFPKAL